MMDEINILQPEFNERVIEIIARCEPSQVAVGDVDRPTAARWIDQDPDVI